MIELWCSLEADTESERQVSQASKLDLRAPILLRCSDSDSDYVSDIAHGSVLSQFIKYLYLGPHENRDSIKSDSPMDVASMAATTLGGV